jgi:hypothetical protein
MVVMSSPARFVVLAVALSASVLVAWPAAAAVRVQRTSAGDKMARAVLVRRADFGAGWRQTPGPARVPALTCPAFNPAINAVTETGAAASPTFGDGSSGPFISADAYVYASTAQTARVWSRVVRPLLSRCVAEGLRAASGNGTKFRVTSSDLLNLPGLKVRRAGYRIAGTATRGGQSVNVFLDALLLTSGRRLLAVSVSSFSAPPPRSLESRLARTLAARLTH